MTAVLIAILTMTVVGLPVTLAIDRSTRGPRLLGLAILYGSAATMFALMALSVLHVPWTALSAMIAMLAIAIVAAVVLRRDSRVAASPHPSSFILHPLDAVPIALFLAYLTYVTIAPLWEWDFWAIWGLKARVFLEHGGIDWAWLENRWNEFAHPDYPPLVTLNYDFAGLLHGGWDDRWLGLFFAAWGAGALLVIRSLAADEVPSWAAAAATAASAIVAMSLYVGMAEGALIAFAATGLLFLRRGDWRHGALLLGLAANCKNEGIALLGATAIALVLAEPKQWRRVVKLWPALALIAPWMLLRATHALPTDIASGPILERFFARAAQIGEVFTVLARALVDKWSWLVLLASFLIVPRAIKRERFIALVTLVQLAFFVATYFITPHDWKWHILTSWQRLTRQVQIPITVVCVMFLAQFALRGEDAPHAEARSDQQ